MTIGSNLTYLFTKYLSVRVDIKFEMCSSPANSVPVGSKTVYPIKKTQARIIIVKPDIFLALISKATR